MSKISVIVPVYNIYDYLEKSLDSVLSQTFQDFEIICVNDCSTDNSIDILNEYANKDGRIKIIDLKENKGVSNARNVGLKEAKGDYIYFFDGDDWIDSDYLEKMYNAITEKNVDIVLNTNVIQHKESAKDMQFLPCYTFGNIENTYIDTRKGVANLIWNVWAHLYKKTYLDRINAKFPEGYPYGEDLYFQYLTYLNTDKIYIIRNSTYHYNKRDANATAKHTKQEKDGVLQLLKIFNLIHTNFSNNKSFNSNPPRLFKNELMPSFLCADREFVLSEIRNYLIKIEPLIAKSKDLYNHYEIDAFQALINDFENAQKIDFQKRLGIMPAISLLRNNIRRKI